MRAAVIAFVARLGIGLLRSTLRIEVRGREWLDEAIRPGGPFILAFWHERLLMMPYAYPRGRRITVLISRHRDGEYIARTMALFGHHSTRGSTTRGGSQALRSLVKKMRAGWDAGFTPDGPRGPRRVVQPGVIQAARLAQAPVVPVAFSAARRTLLSSWDRFLVPAPFSRALILYGAPLRVPPDAGEREMEEARLRLQRELRALTDEADRIVGAEPCPVPEDP